tara:strand:+ start:1936 stop:2400 length:465 start_codon:yes stop_codon:yes gene_type:complete
MNANEQVMEHFPRLLTINESQAFIDRMDAMLEKSKFCYFAVDELESGQFIGFIGLSERVIPQFKTPQIDIGWRLAPIYWNKGYATEGANTVIKYAQNKLGINTLISISTAQNIASIKVMEKIGMKFYQYFNFEPLKDYPELKRCALYIVDLEKR